MYKSIHISNRYRIDRINPDGATMIGSKAKAEVSVLMKDGRYQTLPWGGFTAADNVLRLRLLKIANVIALCEDYEAEKVILAIPRGSFIVGAWIQGQVYICTYDGKPKIIQDKFFDDDRTNNVYSL